MKKLLTVVAVLAAIAGSAFAKENFIDVGFVLPQKIIKVSEVPYKYSGFGGHFAGTTMYSDLIGIQCGLSMSKETRVSSQGKTSKGLANGFDMDTYFGIAIRPVNKNGFNLFITPAFEYGLLLGDSNLLMLLGAGCNVQGTYMFTDTIGLSASSDIGYYFASFSSETSGSLKMFTVNPKLCLTVKL